MLARVITRLVRSLVAKGVPISSFAWYLVIGYKGLWVMIETQLIECDELTRTWLHPSEEDDSTSAGRGWSGWTGGQARTRPPPPWWPAPSTNSPQWSCPDNKHQPSRHYFSRDKRQNLKRQLVQAVETVRYLLDIQHALVFTNIKRYGLQ